MMLLATLFACGGDPPPVKTDPLVAATRMLQLDVGRSGQSLERACAAVEQAITLAPQVQAAVEADPTARDRLFLLGLKEVDGRFQPDWNELAQAVTKDSLAVMLVTVGGVDALREGSCLDTDRLEQWSRRAPTLTQGPECMKDLLLPIYTQTMAELGERCVCAPVSEVRASRMLTRAKTITPTLVPLYETFGTRPVCAPAQPAPDAPVNPDPPQE